MLYIYFFLSSFISAESSLIASINRGTIFSYLTPLNPLNLVVTTSGKTDSIKTLLKQFKNRHGIKFEEKLLDRVKNYFS
jgi:hypothetical protein